MIRMIDLANRDDHRLLFEAMLEDRKRVFVDRLAWDLATDGRIERDQFDNEHARYMVACDSRLGHVGSVRLLPTLRPHLLGMVFSELCDDRVPQGPDIFEISRLCFSPRCRDYASVRDRLTTALVEYALLNAIGHYTLVAGMSVLNGILAQGWTCTPLGMPTDVAGETLGALMINIEPHTIKLLRAAGHYAPGGLELVPSPALAA